MGRYAQIPVIELMTDVYVPRNLRSGRNNTTAAYCQTYRQLQEFWRNKKPDERLVRNLTLADFADEDLIAQFLHSRCNAAIGTRNKDLRHIRLLWNFAEELGESLGKLRLKLEKEHLREPECWSPEELTAVIDSAASEPGYVGDVPARCWWPALILTDYATGARINAMMNTRSDSLDLSGGRLKLSADVQKQKADQWCQLIPEAVAALAAIRPERNVRIFDDWPHDRTEYARERGSWRTLSRRYKQILKRAGLSNGRLDMFHKIRKTFGTEITRAAGIATAQTLLGHSTPKVTARYIDKRFVETPNAATLLRRPTVPIQLRLFTPSQPDTNFKTG